MTPGVFSQLKFIHNIQYETKQLKRSNPRVNSKNIIPKEYNESKSKRVSPVLVGYKTDIFERINRDTFTANLLTPPISRAYRRVHSSLGDTPGRAVRKKQKKKFSNLADTNGIIHRRQDNH